MLLIGNTKICQWCCGEMGLSIGHMRAYLGVVGPHRNSTHQQYRGRCKVLDDEITYCCTRSDILPNFPRPVLGEGGLQEGSILAASNQGI